MGDGRWTYPPPGSRNRRQPPQSALHEAGGKENMARVRDWKMEVDRREVAQLFRVFHVTRVFIRVAKCNFLKFAAIACEISRNHLADLFQEISGNFTKFQEIT